MSLGYFVFQEIRNNLKYSRHCGFPIYAKITLEVE